MNPTAYNGISPDFLKLWNDKIKPAFDKRMSLYPLLGKWGLTHVPSHWDASRDHIPFEDYMGMYLHACSIDNRKITQFNQELIDKITAMEPSSLEVKWDDG